MIKWISGKRRCVYISYIAAIIFCTCKKHSDDSSTPPVHPFFHVNSANINGTTSNATNYGVSVNSVIRFSFSAPVDHSSVNGAISFQNGQGISVPFNASFENADSTLTIQSTSSLTSISKYLLSVSTALKSKDNGSLQSGTSVNFTTAIDSSDKFPLISDDSLLTLVQKQTF